MVRYRLRTFHGEIERAHDEVHPNKAEHKIGSRLVTRWPGGAIQATVLEVLR